MPDAGAIPGKYLQNREGFSLADGGGIHKRACPLQMAHAPVPLRSGDARDAGETSDRVGRLVQERCNILKLIGGSATPRTRMIRLSVN